MKVLKDNWSLTGDLTGSATPFGVGVHFTTNWYDERILTPQVSITPAYSVDTVLNLNCDKYKIDDYLNVNVWLRLSSTSNTSAGKIKADRWSMIQEVKKIIQ